MAEHTFEHQFDRGNPPVQPGVHFDVANLPLNAFVAITGDETVGDATVSGTQVCGTVVRPADTDGGMGVIRCGGGYILKNVQAAAAIVAGAWLQVANDDGNGRQQVETLAGANFIGWALKAAAAPGDLIDMMVVV